MYRRRNKLDECHFNKNSEDKNTYKRALLPLIQMFFYGQNTI
jgi:hypothetical protein